MGYVSELRALIGNRPLVLTGASVLVADAQGRWLLQRRADDGTWGFPGGALEPGETLEQTARRELREEAGLAVGELTLLDVFSGPDCFKVYPNGDQAYLIGAVYLARCPDGAAVHHDHESRELRFFDLGALPTPMEGIAGMLLARHRERLERYARSR